MKAQRPPPKMKPPLVLEDIFAETMAESELKQLQPRCLVSGIVLFLQGGSFLAGRLRFVRI